MKVYFILSILLCGCSFSAYCGEQWDEFLSGPDKSSYTTIEESIVESVQECSWGNPHNLSVVPLEKGQQLYKLIAAGNKYALRVGLMVSRCLDGGELEDFHRSAGLFLDAHPMEFLEIVKETQVSEKDMEFMLTALPEDTIDNIDRAIEVVTNRIALFQGISSSQHEDMIPVALAILSDQKESIEKIKHGSD